MAQKYDRRRYGYTDGSLAYDLDALARERALDDAGRMEQPHREPTPQPKRQPVARPVAKPSPLVLACAVLLTGLVVLLLMGYVRLTQVNTDISEMKSEISQLEERQVALLTQYEKTFDLATVQRVAEEAGMKKPTSGQVEYLELPSSDSAVVYRGDAGTALENIVDSIAAAVSSVVEYFR